jgi:predicted nucleotidyltransferase
MQLTEEQLIIWSKPVSKTEDQKCQNAINQITEIIKDKYGGNVEVFLQGSYENDTNVRQDSDVDIVVKYGAAYYPDLYFLNEQQKEIYYSQRTMADYNFFQFKNDVHKLLESSFGAVNAKRKNKCIYVVGNSNRINADVIPSFTLKRFSNVNYVSAEGIRFYTDENVEINSYPKQHYQSGVSKNSCTSRMYKRTVRILKNIRNKLIETNVITGKLASSFFIECLVYNVPDQNFINDNYSASLNNVITKVYNDMLDNQKAIEYEEVSGLQWLFKGSIRSTEDAKLFMLKCWQYAGF